MRATYSKKSMIAAPADHTSLGSSALRLRPRSARSAQHPGEHSTDASAYAAAYVLDEVAYSSSGGSGGTGGEVGGDGSLGGAPVVPRPRQCFFVRTAAKKAAGTTVLGSADSCSVIFGVVISGSGSGVACGGSSSRSSSSAVVAI